MNFFAYTEVNGSWTVSDSDMRIVWERFEEEGTIQKIFRDGYINTPEDFIHHFKVNGNLYFWTYEGKVGGIFWLNGIEGGRAYLHFNAFKEFWGKPMIVSGKEVVDKLTEYYDVILGLTPKDNPLAYRLAKKIGMKDVGIVPCAVYDAMLDKNVDAWLTYITKEKSDG